MRADAHLSCGKSRDWSVATLTDLEITRLCADAMGLRVRLAPLRGTIMRYWFMDASGYNPIETEYYPLGNDAQAVALVKRFHIDTEFTAMAGWGAEETEAHIETEWDGHIRVIADTWNRAVVACVAKMRAKGEESRRT